MGARPVSEERIAELVAAKLEPKLRAMVAEAVAELRRRAQPPKSASAVGESEAARQKRLDQKVYSLLASVERKLKRPK